MNNKILSLTNNKILSLTVEFYCYNFILRNNINFSKIKTLKLLTFYAAFSSKRLTL